MNNDRINENLDQECMQHMEPNEAELERNAVALRPLFRKAVESAIELKALEGQRTTSRWRTLVLAAASAAIVLVVCVVSIVMLKWPQHYPFVDQAIAEDFGGVTAVVISSYNRRVVPNVQVIEQRQSAAGQLVESLVARTNAQGFFSIPPDELGATRSFVLNYSGKVVGKLLVGQDERAARGYQRIQVDVPPVRQQTAYEITVEPGETIELTGSLRVSHAAEAPAAWSGTVSHDGHWPAEFNYGDVLDGIFTAIDAVPQGLRLEVRLDLDYFQLAGFSATEVRLIAHSAKYVDACKSDTDILTRYDRYVHRGWYVATDPPRDFLQAVEPALLTNQAGEVWFSWAPEAGRPYALIAPVSGEWEAGLIFWNNYRGPDLIQARPDISLLSQSDASRAAWIYDVEQLVDGIEEPFYLPFYPQVNFPSIYTLSPEPRGYTDLYAGHDEMFAASKELTIPAQYWLRRYDLTCTTPQRQGPFTVNLGFVPGHYEVVHDNPELGSITRLKLTGDLDRIKGKPSWDFDHDAVPDAFGLEADYLATAAGAYPIMVLLQDVSGEYVRVSHDIVVLAEGMLGCVRSGYAHNAVVAGTEQLPSEVFPFWVISEMCIGAKSTSSLHITNTAGPSMYIEPPDEWVGKRLKEIRQTIFISPRAGDYEQMFISPAVDAIQRSDGSSSSFEPLPMLLGTVDGKRQEFPEGWLHTTGICWPVDIALNAVDDPRNYRTARQSWLEYIKSRSIGPQVELLLGFEVNNPPPEDQLIEIMREFKASPYYSVKYAVEEYQELTYATNLFEAEITPELAFLVGTQLEHQNVLLASQYEVFSGAQFPARVELETTDGEVYIRYFDYSVVD